MTKSAFLARTALTLSICIPGVTFAQEAPLEAAAGTVEIDEITVTAQKREQILLDIPQSVSVIGGATLERQQATNFQDYLKLVPGLQLNQSTPGNGRLILRGINTGGVASTVAVYVDETPFGSSSGLVNGSVLAGDFDTFDMARIEVLRGPQGTLYGASSLGGVLKFVPNRPDTDAFEARGRATAESTSHGDMGYSGSAVVNFPLSDALAVRATGYYRDIGGFVDSIGTAGSDIEDDINDSRSYGGRVSALFEPSDQLSVQLTAHLQNIANDATSDVESNAFTLRTLYGDLTQSQYVPEFNNFAYRVYNATINYDFGFANITSATSYNMLDHTLRLDLTPQFSPLLRGIIGPNELYQDQQTDQRKITQELRLASASSDSFEWLLGGYYTREKGLILQDITAVTPGTLTPIAGLPVLANARLTSRYRELAGFANATIYLGDRFDLTFGGRYSHNRQKADQASAGILAGGGAVLPTVRSSEDVFTYSVAPRFEFSDNASFYARVAKGFRPGGPNVVPPAAPPTVPRTYDSDSLISYEIGFKAETEDSTFSIDVAAFHIDWKDIQLFARVNNFGVNINGGGADSDGLEFTATARPTDGLSFSVNGAYTDAKLTDSTDPLVGGRDGDRLPFSPKYSIGLNGDYEWTVGEDATAFVGASLRALSQQSGAFDFAFVTANGRQRRVPSYEVIDLRAGVDFGRFLVEAFAKNLTDREGKTSTGGLGTSPGGAIPTGVIRPRTIGLTVGAEF